MKSRARWLAFGIGLALAQRAWAGNTFEAVLVGTNEVPEPGMADGSFVAIVVVDGTSVTLTLTPKEAKGWMSAHIHKGVAGVTGRLVAEFPWTSGDGSPRTSSASVSETDAAGLLADPAKYYLDVHTPAFPAGAARGQLAARLNAASAAAAPTPLALPASQASEPPRAGIVPPEGLPGAPRLPLSPREQVISFPEPRSRIYRDSDFRLEATASSGLRVTFSASGDCTVNGNMVHILSAGKCWVTAHQPGGARFDAAEDVEQRIVIEKANQRIEGGAPATRKYLDPDFPVPMSASSGLPVVFFAWGDCTLNGTYLHITGAGSCSFTGHQPGDSNYLAAPIVEQRFKIAKADQTIEFAEFTNPYFGPYEILLVATASSGLPVSFGISGPCAIRGDLLRIVDAGECSVTAMQEGDRNFNRALPVKRTLQVVVPPPRPSPPPG